MAGVEDGWGARCTAVLDELVAARLRRNAEVAAHSGEGSAPVLEFVPSQRDVRLALRERYGSAPSFRDIGALVTDYLLRNKVYDKLPVSPRGRTRAEPVDAALPVPQRVLAAIDQHLGALDASRRKLAAIYAQVASDENSIQQRRIKQLEVQLAQAETALADSGDMAEVADLAEERASALQDAVQSAEAVRDNAVASGSKSQAELDEALQRLAELNAERDLLLQECKRLGEVAATVESAVAARQSAERGRDEAIRALAKLSGNEQALEDLRSALLTRQASAREGAISKAQVPAR